VVLLKPGVGGLSECYLGCARVWKSWPTHNPVFPECLNIMGLAHPVSSKSLTRHGSPHFKIGAASMQGFRNGACLCNSSGADLESFPLGFLGDVCVTLCGCGDV